MCISPEEIRRIVHQELDNKLVLFMEKVDESINSRLSHMESSPQTRKEIESIKEALKKHDEDEIIHWGKIDEMLEFQKESMDAINTVKDFLAGGRILAIVTKFITSVGIVVGGIIAFKIWIIGR